MRRIVLVIYYAAMVTAALSLVYLLFAFGHTETTPLPYVLTTAAVAGVSALIAGILQWAGLPIDPKKKDEKQD